MMIDDRRGGARALVRNVFSLTVTTVLGAMTGPVLAGGIVNFTNTTNSAGLGAYVAQAGDGHAPGAVFADLNDDGYPDLYLMRSWGNINHLYLNVDNGGTRAFVRVPGDAGLGHPGDANGAIAADYDNDGDVDIYLINFDQPNVLYQSQLADTGSFVFVDVTAQTDPTPGDNGPDFGVGDAEYEGAALDNSLTAAWSDVDRDGDLDLFVGNHNGFFGSGFEGPFSDPGRRDVFYINHGDGTFSDMTMHYDVPGFSTSSGAHSTNNQRFSSSNAVIFADFDNDRWPDLFVTNKVGGPDDRDMLYRNLGVDGGGTWLGFELMSYDMSPDFGTRTGGAMGVDVADPDNDGDLDIYITDWSDLDDPPLEGRNDLYVNQLMETGSLDFVHDDDAAPALYSWGIQFQDFDNDGWQDLHVACQGGAPDFLYMNLGTNILTGWSDVAPAEGMNQTGNGRGDVTADYDRDGWVDLLVINRNGPSVLYHNRSGALHPNRSFLSIKLIGDPDAPGPLRSTRDAIGARLNIYADVNGDGTVATSERQIREVVSGSSNAASTSSLESEVGLGAANVAVVEILWPSGTTSAFLVNADQFLTFDESLLIAGDINGDHVVSFTDILLIISNWGPCNGGVCPADVNQDGTVGFGDILLAIVNWM